MKNDYFRSLITVDDFKQKMDSTLSYSGVNTPSTDRWTYIDSEKAAHINNSTKKGYARIGLGRLHIGDVIEINAEVYNISGVKAKLAVDNATPGVEVKTSKKQGVYEKIHLHYVVQSEDEYSIVCGIWTGEIGEIKIRNVAVKVSTIRERVQTEIRKVTLYTSAIGVFSIRADKNYDPCTFTVSGGDLTITFNEPLQEMGMPFIGLEHYANSKKYLFRASYATKNSLVIQAYDLTATDPTQAVLMSTIPLNTYVHVMLLA